MALNTAFRNGIATARKILSDGGMLQSVTVQTLGAKNSYGERTPTSSVTIDALVEDITRIVRLADGSQIITAARVTFLEPVTMALTKDDTRVVLANGRTSLVVNVDRAVMPGDGTPLIVAVYLGELVGRSG